MSTGFLNTSRAVPSSRNTQTTRSLKLPNLSVIQFTFLVISYSSCSATVPLTSINLIIEQTVPLISMNMIIEQTLLAINKSFKRWLCRSTWDLQTYWDSEIFSDLLPIHCSQIDCNSFTLILNLDIFLFLRSLYTSVNARGVVLDWTCPLASR